MHRSWIVAIAVLALSGCGFQFRQDAALSPSLRTVYIAGVPGNGVYRFLSAQFTAHGATLLDKPSAQHPQLILGGIRSETHVVSVDDRNQAAEYLQQYTLDYQLLLPEREPLRQTLTFNRSFFNQTSLALGASRESELLNYEMERQAALRIFWKLSQLNF